MFHLILVLLSFIPLSVVTADEIISCEAAARRLGQPLDGWKTRTSISDGAHHDERCVREVVDLQCVSGRQLYNPDIRIAECCPEDGSITWQDEAAKLGFCCAAGHKWSGDISTGEGGCCVTGLVMIDGLCTDPQDVSEKSTTSGSGYGCSSKRGHSPGSISDGGTSGVSVDPEMDNLNNQLGGEPVDLGILYGHCYYVSPPDSKRVGSNRENVLYTPGGLFQIPFRVCKSTSDCTKGHTGETVSSKTKFFLQDQIGRHNDPSGTLGWVLKTNRGTLKMAFTANEEEATAFFGRRDGVCDTEESCGLRLSGLPIELRFSETSCPSHGRSLDEL